MKWLSKFMYGRYGYDDFGLCLLILGLICSVISFFVAPVGIVAYVFYIFCAYRMLSRQTGKRSQENDKFLGFFMPIVKKFRIQWDKIKYRKTYKYFKCPQCHQYLRVPRGKGDIVITCPHCHHTFDANSGKPN